jgi:hypothetical protein
MRSSSEAIWPRVDTDNLWVLFAILAVIVAALLVFGVHIPNTILQRP